MGRRECPENMSGRCIDERKGGTIQGEGQCMMFSA